MGIWSTRCFYTGCVETGSEANRVPMLKPFPPRFTIRSSRVPERALYGPTPYRAPRPVQGALVLEVRQERDDLGGRKVGAGILSIQTVGEGGAQIESQRKSSLAVGGVFPYLFISIERCLEGLAQPSLVARIIMTIQSIIKSIMEVYYYKSLI